MVCLEVLNPKMALTCLYCHSSLYYKRSSTFHSHHIPISSDVAHQIITGGNYISECVRNIWLLRDSWLSGAHCTPGLWPTTTGSWDSLRWITSITTVIVFLKIPTEKYKAGPALGGFHVLNSRDIIMLRQLQSWPLWCPVCKMPPPCGPKKSLLIFNKSQTWHF